MSDLSGWDPEWDKYLAERGLRRRKDTSLAFNERGTLASVSDTGYRRWIGRTDSATVGNSFQARVFRAPGDGTYITPQGYQFTDWKSPAFPDPVTAFVYAELHNWGQHTVGGSSEQENIQSPQRPHGPRCQLQRRGTIKTPSWVAVLKKVRGGDGSMLQGWESPVFQTATAAAVYAKICNWGQNQ